MFVCHSYNYRIFRIIQELLVVFLDVSIAVKLALCHLTKCRG